MDEVERVKGTMSTLEHLRRWSKDHHIRHTDVMSLVVLAVALFHLAIVATIAAAQPGTVQDFIDNDQTRRIANLENLNLPQRIAVLERTAAEWDETQSLLYGVMVTLAGSLIAQGLQIAGQRRRRGARDESE